MQPLDVLTTHLPKSNNATRGPSGNNTPVADSNTPTKPTEQKHTASHHQRKLLGYTRVAFSGTDFLHPTPYRHSKHPRQRHKAPASSTRYEPSLRRSHSRTSLSKCLTRPCKLALLRSTRFPINRRLHSRARSILIPKQTMQLPEIGDMIQNIGVPKSPIRKTHNPASRTVVH